MSVAAADAFMAIFGYKRIEFKFTNHAKERFKERFNNGDPMELIKSSRIAGPNVRKKIRKECPQNLTDQDHVYYVNDYHHKPLKLVFVCKRPIDDEEYIVKTFFVLGEKEKVRC